MRWRRLYRLTFRLWLTLVWATIGWMQNRNYSSSGNWSDRLVMTAAQRKESELVYRRSHLSDNSTPPVDQPPFQVRSIAPTITPIIIGFLVLLGLITGLGLLSAKQMDQVSFNARDLVSQNSAHQSVLLNLRLAVTKLITRREYRVRLKRVVN
jgi:hypothetical protein